MNYQVVFGSMPGSVKAFTAENDDGSYTIIINSRLDRHQQRETFLHEFHHIAQNHFIRCGSVDEIERRCRSEKGEWLWDCI